MGTCSRRPASGTPSASKATPETIVVGVAGLEGDLFGWTTPSETGVEVVGGAPDDVAVFVDVDRRPGEFWIRPDLIVLVDENIGGEIRLGSRTFVKQPDREWVERPRRGLLGRWRRRP